MGNRGRRGGMVPAKSVVRHPAARWDRASQFEVGRMVSNPQNRLCALEAYGYLGTLRIATSRQQWHVPADSAVRVRSGRRLASEAPRGAPPIVSAAERFR
jgi:hypothetical protein